MKLRLTTKRLVLAVFLILGLLVIRPVTFLIYTYIKDPKASKSLRSAVVNDASQLNRTKVDTVVKAHKEINRAITQISDLIKEANASGKKISIAGAQHSMGGHTIYPGGILLDMNSFNYMLLDSTADVLNVGSGALWNQIIPYLDQYGKSVAVMQSNNSFSVGGSISVNCHGWQPNSPPIASTVISLRLINAKGEVLSCSRTENKELFSLVLGGYGLFGVILDVKLRVTDNKIYKAEQFVVKSADYVREFEQWMEKNPTTGLAFGRININPDHFMEEAILSTYVVTDGPVQKLHQKNTFAAIRRTVFRGSANSEYGKNLRWKLEKSSVSLVDGKTFTRNELLNEGVEVFQNTNQNYTDILHEYFIPKAAVPEFIKALQSTIPKYRVDLLNITVRNVMTDKDSYLNYAHQEVFGFVMLFNQKRSKEAEADMQALTRKLITISISLNGAYYLPYRLHATKEQLLKAYPQASAFFELKRKYDPTEAFSNSFYKVYAN
ncbi:FAD-binding oxidoreductase [Pedobacter hiemivivus]|uniref:FAD-binding oxidoreductase n=1 Tax=Pedobacter hiemivivus TaxID=2530454 RepID=A0A4U1G406_9SPHI|nr:FAD-binding oxidoreductase [Pedobacter hiemivivus]TCC97009.1 FAD-binding oxidoreductase [Pedobacter hiemivivus]TKC57569.1 FAD-binding oxidoreductase [Pedobacter hiemivivus]